MTIAVDWGRKATKPTKTGTMVNREDPDEMPHYAASHQSLHCLHRQNRHTEKKKNEYIFGN